MSEELVNWAKFPSGKRWVCVIGGVCLSLSQRRKGGWALDALGRGWFFEAPSLSAAKTKALNKVRRAILAAAEAWSVAASTAAAKGVE